MLYERILHRICFLPHLAPHVAEHLEPVAGLGLDDGHDGLVPRDLRPLLALAPNHVVQAVALGAHLK